MCVAGSRYEMKGGRKLHEQIDEAIRLHDRLLLILSKDSEGPDSERRVGSMSSEWVKVEIRKARQREIKEGKRVLFPIRLVSYEALRDWNLPRRHGEEYSRRDTRVLHPRLQQLEGARFVSDGVSAAGERSEGGECRRLKPAEFP